jgi:dTDP-4-dehydrorhamnose reductase
LNNYAKTNFEAEHVFLSFYNKAFVVWTNIFGFRKIGIDSFFEWLLNSIKEQRTINLFSNFYTSPISVNELSEILLKCHNKGLNGIYNISSSEVIDKFNFGIRTAEKFGYSTDNISKIAIQNNFQDNVTRALTLGLDVSKIETALSIKMPTVDETLDSLLKKYEEIK